MVSKRASETKALQKASLQRKVSAARSTSDKFTAHQVSSRFKKEVEDGENQRSRFDSAAAAKMASAGSRSGRSNMPMGLAGRRNNRFSLEQDSSGMQSASLGGEGGDFLKYRDESGLGSAGHGGAMGEMRPLAYDDGGDAGDSAQGDTKAVRRDRFERVILDSRSKRIELQKHRAEKEAATTELDAEFAEIKHLIQRRDKAAEAADEFSKPSDPAVGKLLAARQAEKKKTGGGSCKFVLEDSGVLRPAQQGGRASRAPPGGLDDDDKRLLESIRTAKGSSKRQRADDEDEVEANEAQHRRVAATDDNEAGGFGAIPEMDDFDKLASMMRLDTRIIASDRVISEEERREKEEHEARLKERKMQGEQLELDVGDYSRKEWLERGGDTVHHMEDEEDEGSAVGDEELGKPKQQLHPIDELIGRVEEFVGNCAKGDASGKAVENASFEDLGKIIELLYSASRSSPMYAVKAFRLVLVEIERCRKRAEGSTTSSATITDVHVALMYCALSIFPLTDHTHPVITPLMVLLGSLIMEHRLLSLKDVQRGLVYASMFIRILTESKKFASEPVIMLLNVISLQVPRRTIQPRDHGSCGVPFPMLPRGGEALLNPESKRVAASQPALPLPIFSKKAPSPASLLVVAYNLLDNLVDVHGHLPGFAACYVDPMVSLDDTLTSNDAILVITVAKHKEIMARLRETEQMSKDMRVPLQLRAFRPKPLRQFEPLLIDASTAEEKTTRELKKEVKEDRKRVVRQIAADAHIDRHLRDKERAAVEAHKERKLNELYADIEKQQHIMKTVDSLMDKSKSKKKKKISG